jgi:hypothetical protein
MRLPRACPAGRAVLVDQVLNVKRKRERSPLETGWITSLEGCDYLVSRQVIPRSAGPRVSAGTRELPLDQARSTTSVSQGPPGRLLAELPGTRVRRLALTAACHRAKYDLGPDPEDDQIEDHLPGDQDPCPL